MTNQLQALFYNWLTNSNKEGTALASAARTATVSSADITNYNGKGITVILDVTAKGTAPSITLKIQQKDPASGKYIDLITSAAVTTVSTNTYRVFPNLTAAANLTANATLGKTFRITMTHSNADSITYSVGYSIN